MQKELVTDINVGDKTICGWSHFWLCDFEKVNSNTDNSLLIFLIMNIGGFFVGILRQDSLLYIGAIIMSIISSTMLYFINK